LGAGNDFIATTSRAKESVLTLSDIEGQFIYSAFGGKTANYCGQSKLYRAIEADPNSHQDITFSSVMMEVPRAELAVVTAGVSELGFGGYEAAADGDYTGLQDTFAGYAVGFGALKTRASLQSLKGLPKAKPGSYRPPDPLPRGPNGEMLPSSSCPHTQLGTGTSRKVGPYTQAREFGENGEWIRDIDFTDHGRPNIPGHVNPHQHRAVPNPTGGTPGRGPAEPFVP
jgi:hypothetical protein